MAWNIADTTYNNKQSIKIFFLFLFQHILLARCKGFCNKSKTEPRVTFSPVLYRPFNYHCKCCRDSLSIMKAVRLTCEGNKTVFATYRYILRCKCRNCNFRRWWFVLTNQNARCFPLVVKQNGSRRFCDVTKYTLIGAITDRIEHLRKSQVFPWIGWMHYATHCEVIIPSLR